jgi:transcriptional regulator with XRE-family HTH domain
MKLSDWLESRNITAAELARRLGVSRSTISKIIKGDRLPSVKLIQDIQKQTGGRVGFKDLTIRKEKADSRQG